MVSVAYKLKLPTHVWIHATFNVSVLKKKVRLAPVQALILAGVTDRGQLMMKPIAILDRCIARRG